jgi:hypothetical protein
MKGEENDDGSHHCINPDKSGMRSGSPGIGCS